MFPTLQILCDAAPPAPTPKSTQQNLDRFLSYENQIMQQMGWQFVIDLERA